MFRSIWMNQRAQHYTGTLIKTDRQAIYEHKDYKKNVNRKIQSDKDSLNVHLRFMDIVENAIEREEDRQKHTKNIDKYIKV